MDSFIAKTSGNDPASIGLKPSGDGTIWTDSAYGRALRHWGVVGVDAVMRSNQGECLRKLDDRENWFLPTPEGPSRGMYLKKHHPAGRRGLKRSIVEESPGLVEARNIGRLLAAGIGTMRVVAYGEGSASPNGKPGESFLLTESLDGYEPLDDYLRRRFSRGGSEESEAFNRLIDAVAAVARRFHSAGFNHRDFYCCHFFVKEAGDGFDVRLIDLQRMQYRQSRRRRWIVKDLAQLAYSAPRDSVDCKTRVRFLRGYFGVSKLGKNRKTVDCGGVAKTAIHGVEAGKKRMKIGLVIEHFDPRRGGVEHWTAQFAARLIERGHEVHVVARSFSADAARSRIVPHPVLEAPSRIDFAQVAQEILESLDLDVIHDTGYGWHCDVFQPHGGSRCAVAEQNLLLLPKWMRRLKKAVSRLLPRYRQFDALTARQFADDGRTVLALSRRVAADFTRFHSIPVERTRLVYNGVDTDRFHPDRRREFRGVVRDRLGIGRDELVFLIVAHNFKLKGVPTLLKALGDWRRRGLPARLLVVGGKHSRRYRFSTLVPRAFAVGNLHRCRRRSGSLLRRLGRLRPTDLLRPVQSRRARSARLRAAGHYNAIERSGRTGHRGQGGLSSCRSGR